jgi:hypothetical protein
MLHSSKRATNEEGMEKISTIEVVSAFKEAGLLRMAARDFALPSTKI